MLSEVDLCKLYDELNKPYSVEEFETHCQDRLLKCWFEITHAHNYELIDLADETLKYFQKEGPKPERKLWAMIRPGNNNDNAACGRLQRIARYIGEHYEHGSVPRLPIIVFTSRSTATLLDRLAKVFDSEHLDNAAFAAKEFFCLIGYSGNPQMDRGSFVQQLNELANTFITECQKHAQLFGQFTNQMYRAGKLEEAKTNEIKDVIIEQHEKTRGKIAASEKAIVSEVHKATNGSFEGCHHKIKAKDAIVQQVIKHLAKPGVTFSINDACCKIAGKLKPGRCSTSWLYDWCHRHHKEIQTSVEILRSQGR